tara:strand:- start:15 stop:461 length:447 start_codon:yes stop_codon:yes gene_type:complete
MIAEIKQAAESVGVTAFITNSTEKIEVQLNRLTSQADLPIMLVSWDLEIKMDFNDNGFLDNPTSDVVCLLLGKPEDTTKEEAENMAEDMYFLYLDFLQELRDTLSPKLVNYQSQPIINAGCKLVPVHGLGKHSGVLGRFTMITGITNC